MTQYYDDGSGSIWRLCAGAYLDHVAIVRCREHNLSEVLAEVFPDLFEPMEYPEQAEDMDDGTWYQACQYAETDLTIVHGHEQKYIPSWEWGYSEASDDDVIEWKLWFAEQNM